MKNWTWLAIAFAVAGGAWIGHAYGASKPPVYNRVEVPVEKIREVERVDTVIHWREKIVYRTAKPVTVATSEGGARSDVERFCSQQVDTVRIEGAIRVDSVYPAVLLLRSVRTDPGWFGQADQVVFTGPLGNGDLRQLTYNVRPGWQGHVLADSMLVQSPRWWLLREGLEAGVFVGLGYLIGRVF